jgi:hypothetical protein
MICSTGRRNELRHFRTATEADNEIGPLVADAEPTRELPAQFRNFDRLIHERIFYAERRRLQCKALARAPRLEPMRLVVALGYEHGDAGRSAKLLHVFFVLALFGEHERQAAISQTMSAATDCRLCAPTGRPCSPAAAASLKRIQSVSSFMKSGSRICAESPARHIREHSRSSDAR